MIVSLLGLGSLLLYVGGQSNEREEETQLNLINQKNHLTEIQSLLPYKYQNESLNGKALVVNLWATWCGPCLEEIPELNKLAMRADTSKVFFLAYSSEPASELDQLKESMPDFQFDYHLAFEHLPLEDYLLKLDAKNRAQSIPVHMLIDPDGRLAHVLVGATPGNLTQIRKFVEQHCKSKNHVKIEF